jgi:hypothetical protein
MLRVYIAANYPCVPEEDAARIIKRIITCRRKDNVQPGTKDGWGYTGSQVAQFKAELQSINSRWVGTLSMPKMVGTGQTVF